MRVADTIRRGWEQGWSWMPALTAFVLPLHPRLSVISLIVWGLMALLGWGIQMPSQRCGRKQELNWSSIGPVLYFIGLALGMLWTDQIQVGWFALEVKSTLVILPALFFLQLRWSPNEKWVSRAIQAFLVGLAVYMLWRFMQAGVHSDPALWRYDGLAGPFHPSYIAAYLTLGMFLMPSKSRLRIPFLLLTALFVGLLASKAGWLVAVLVLVVMLVKSKIRSARWDGFVVLAAGMLCLGAIWGDQGRMREFMGYATEHSAEVTRDVEPEHGGAEHTILMTETGDISKKRKVGSSAGRMQAWRASWTLLMKHPGGVGTGDVVQELVRVYETQGSEYALLKRMNPHSAYVQALVTLGWFGGLILLLWWGGLVRESWKRKSWNLAVFAAIVISHGFFESILELQQGVVAWVFLGLLFVKQARMSDEPNLEGAQ
ncbi:MAG: O-antigen ligase family protein [Flavobacteriales bacterium]|nr:O-antigen ligase family protein [Flavobacteriales bacterium]